MATGRVAVQNLQEEELDGRNGREYAVTPRRVTHLTARSEDSVGLQERGPLRSEALQDGGDVGNQLAISCMTEYLT
jgi:hypothetical protein